MKLFQKFICAEGAGKLNIIGLGLGLYPSTVRCGTSVAKQIVKGHNGKIWADIDKVIYLR